MTISSFRKNLTKSLPVVLALLAFTPLLTLAAEFIPLTNLPGVSEAGNAPTLPYFLNNLYKLCIGAAAVIAVLQIMRAGVLFMTSAGSVSHNEQAKGLIQNSVLGLVLVLSPAIVFGIINPKILNLDLDVSGLQSSPKTDTTVPQGNTYVDNQPGAQVRCADKGGRSTPNNSTGGTLCTLPTGSCPVFTSGSDITPIVGAPMEACCTAQKGCTVSKNTPKSTYCQCVTPTN